MFYKVTQWLNADAELHLLHADPQAVTRLLNSDAVTPADLQKLTQLLHQAVLRYPGIAYSIAPRGFSNYFLN
jgi:hypothetical protein